MSEVSVPNVCNADFCCWICLFMAWMRLRADLGKRVDLDIRVLGMGGGGWACVMEAAMSQRLCMSGCDTFSSNSDASRCFSSGERPGEVTTSVADVGMWLWTSSFKSGRGISGEGLRPRHAAVFCKMRYCMSKAVPLRRVRTIRVYCLRWDGVLSLGVAGCGRGGVRVSVMTGWNHSETSLCWVVVRRKGRVGIAGRSRRWVGMRVRTGAWSHFGVKGRTMVEKDAAC